MKSPENLREYVAMFKCRKCKQLNSDMDSNINEYVAIFKCRKCKQLIGDMGVHIWLTKTENSYEISENENCERLERFSNQTKVHKRCFGVCEIIRFDEV